LSKECRQEIAKNKKKNELVGYDNPLGVARAQFKIYEEIETHVEGSLAWTPSELSPRPLCRLSSKTKTRNEGEKTARRSIDARRIIDLHFYTIWLEICIFHVVVLYFSLWLLILPR
jgi:hypothetical protein